MLGKSIPPGESHPGQLPHPQPAASSAAKSQFGPRTSSPCSPEPLPIAGNTHKGKTLLSTDKTTCAVQGPQPPSSPGNCCKQSSEKASLYIKSVTELQSAADALLTLRAIFAQRRLRNDRAVQSCVCGRFQRLPGCVPGGQGSAADEQALSLLGRVSNPLRKG